jgi:ParB-like chromosome segregation protein Spo0J
MTYEIERISTKDLTPYARNARTHSDAQIEQIARSISEFGFNNPVLIDNDNGIIAGHGRVMAAAKINMDEVPCIRLSKLTPEQKKAYILADNRLALDAGWDAELLKLELSELVDLDFDIDLLGFSDAELSDLLDFKTVNPGLTDDEDIPDIQENVITKQGDVWVLGNHRLMCDDSTSVGAVEKLINGNKIDLVFSDPPYGIDVVQGKNSTVGGAAPTKFAGTDGASNIVEAKTYSKIIGDSTTETAREFYNACVSMGFKNIVLWGGNYFTDFLSPSRCWVIWDKEMTGNFSEAEMAWTSFSKGGVKVFKFLWNGLSRQGNRKDELKGRVHPTQKPVGLFQNIFERFDDFKVIYDGFGGSGSTMIACEKLSRTALLMELDPKYCDVIVNRWQNFTGLNAVLESTGETFNKMAGIEDGSAAN